MKNIIKKYFKGEKTITIGWSLGTSPEDVISQFFESDFESEPNESDWDEINDSICNFESAYEGILSLFGSNPREFGHDSNDDLVGDIDVTVKNLIKILETGEDATNCEIVFTSGSGRLNVDELDILHQSVDATLTFYIPSDLYEIL